jgi:hypothetical protein
MSKNEQKNISPFNLEAKDVVPLTLRDFWKPKISSNKNARSLYVNPMA